MADDASVAVERLQAELRELQRQHAAIQAEAASLGAERAALRAENARLFSELGECNAELNDALDRQAATSDVLRVVASTPADLPRVLQSIIDTAARLCDAPSAGLQQFRE